MYFDLETGCKIVASPEKTTKFLIMDQTKDIVAQYRQTITSNEYRLTKRGCEYYFQLTTFDPALKQKQETTISVNQNIGQLKCDHCRTDNVHGCAHEYVVYIMREMPSDDFQTVFKKSIAEYKMDKIEVT